MITDRCSLCPGTNACLGPSGPEDADLLFIGEAPGKDENKKGQVFIGKTGDEVNRHYLPLAGLRRNSVRFTNAIACLPVSAGGKLDPGRAADIALLECCANSRLYPLIDGHGSPPTLLIPMGAFACRAVFGEAFDLELKHGIPQDTPWGIPAFPMYHPALGIHEPKKMLYIRTDWDRLRKYLRGTLQTPTDAYPEVDYQEVTDADEISELDPQSAIALDTESSREGPYCLTYSQSDGTGRLIRAGALPLLSAFNTRMQSWQGPILFHHWLYDQPVTVALGLQLPHRRIVDTILRIFHLGNLPQGLKALAYRELGMEMEDFEDVVTPYSRFEVIKYFHEASLLTWPKPEEQLERQEDGKWKLYKPQGMNTKLKRFFTDLESHPDKDVFKAWGNWSGSHQMIESTLGPWPGLDIRHAPFDKVLRYACRDVDALIRLWPLLKGMSKHVRRYSQELWGEKARMGSSILGSRG